MKIFLTFGFGACGGTSQVPLRYLQATNYEMKNLYVIGNGFDLYHGLDTSYQSFAKYLAENQAEIYDLILEYYSGLPDLRGKSSIDKEFALWAQFESALAD